MLQIIRFEEQYRGGSFPVRILADNGKKYILKMKGAGNGARSLVQEFIVNKAASNLGFPVPGVQIVQIPLNYPWGFGTDEFDDIVQKSFGANLGIDYISDAEAIADPVISANEINFLNQMLAIDYFFRNLDRTDQSGNILFSETSTPWLIDHGSCQFLDAHHRTYSNIALPTNHMFAGRKLLDFMWIQKLTEFIFEGILREIPEEWLSEIQISVHDIMLAIECRKKAFSQCYGT